MTEIQCRRFAVDETPYCLWDKDIRQLNLDFLDAIDPRYFEHVANIQGRLLDSDEKQYAATALRVAYSHGLESLFALLSATIQAPDCVVGWLLTYRNTELFSFLRKIKEGKFVYTRLKIRLLSWRELVEQIHSCFTTGDTAKDGRLCDSFSLLWERFALDFLDDKFSIEYNSIKHGLRVGMGGFHFALGPEETPGVPCSPERMTKLGGSEFGSSFFIPKPIHNTRNLRLTKASLNWNPTNYIYRLHLISISIANVISFAKVLNEVPSTEVKFSWPSDESSFEEAWETAASVTSFTYGPVFDEGDMKPLSKDEILSIYRAEDTDSEGPT